MALLVFYISVTIVCIFFLVSIYFKPLHMRHIIIGIASIAYSLIFDVIFGAYLKLYFYINSSSSLLYIVLASIFLYALLNIVYTFFLPKKLKGILVYTGIWITAMLIFEMLSLLSKTIVFTGWKPIPWSFLTYIITYVWVYFFIDIC